MISIESHGDFSKVNSFLEKIKGGLKLSFLDKCGQEGVEALAAATPIESGKTAESWSYSIDRKKDSVSITWSNSNVVDGVNIAILLQYGHATRSGTWITGLEYIEPAIQPVFIKILNACEKEVKRL